MESVWEQEDDRFSQFDDEEEDIMCSQRKQAKADKFSRSMTLTALSQAEIDHNNRLRQQNVDVEVNRAEFMAGLQTFAKHRKLSSQIAQLKQTLFQINVQRAAASHLLTNSNRVTVSCRLRPPVFYFSLVKHFPFTLPIIFDLEEKNGTGRFLLPTVDSAEDMLQDSRITMFRLVVVSRMSKAYGAGGNYSYDMFIAPIMREAVFDGTDQDSLTDEKAQSFRAVLDACATYPRGTECMIPSLLSKNLTNISNATKEVAREEEDALYDFLVSDLEHQKKRTLAAGKKLLEREAGPLKHPLVAPPLPMAS